MATDVRDSSNVTLSQQIICTCLGSSVTSICTTPLDVVKVRLQAHQKFNRSRPFKFPPVICDCTKLFSNSFCMRYEHTSISCFQDVHQFVIKRPTQISNLFNSSLNVFVNLVKYEGIRSLWSGLTPALVMSIPGTMIYFTAYDRLKETFGYLEPNSSKLHIPVIAGTLARAAAVMAVCPIELVRTKMQSTTLSYKQLYRAIHLSVNLYGGTFLFRGLGPSLLRDVPFSALYWLSYETIKIWYKKKTNLDTPPLSIIFASGALSGMVAAIITCPFDVIKTHRQIELGEIAGNVTKSISSSSSISTPSTWHLLQHLYKSKGVQALCAGIVPRLIKVAPACAIMITIYEYGKLYFQDLNKQNLCAVQSK